MRAIARWWRTRWNDARRAMATCWHRAHCRSASRCRPTAGYLLGSIPTAVLVGRRRRVDLRTVGDRNPGYWNAKEALGRRAALPVLVGDVAKGAAGGGDRAGRRRRGDWWLGYVGGGGGDGRPRLAAVRPLPRRPQRGDLRRRAGVLAPAAAALAIGAGVAVGRATDSSASGIRAGFGAYPVAQLLIDGPRRTAATGGLMSIVGLRFWLRRASDREARPRQAARSADARADRGGDGDDVGGRRQPVRRRRAGRRRRPCRPACRRGPPAERRPADRHGGRRARRAAAAWASGTTARSTSCRPRPSTPGSGSERPHPRHASRRRLVHPHRQQIRRVERGDGEAGRRHRPHEGDVLDGVVGDGAEAARRQQHARGARHALPVADAAVHAAPASTRRAARRGRRAS